MLKEYIKILLEQEDKKEKISIEKFANNVKKAINVAKKSDFFRKTQRIFGDAIFIAPLFSIYETMFHNQIEDLEEFKEFLLKAHQKGLLVLKRLDLVGAIKDNNLVKRSEINYMNMATFHLVNF